MDTIDLYVFLAIKSRFSEDCVIYKNVPWLTENAFLVTTGKLQRQEAR